MTVIRELIWKISLYQAKVFQVYLQYKDILQTYLQTFVILGVMAVMTLMAHRGDFLFSFIQD